ncbi:putative glucosamine-6-phosphate deaminase 1 [Paratrimastix pyriformis]|uniref:Glucosamine-6-phosphate deaminase 1 n=1 Tax=Paratrimastix pyriformis TaxID=342808 RepID=A0ABQ8USP2_9EUKA|nr:putative glucosamine-6-phosphate deaminase 1 [Paratrimastix pyriformis]
MSECTLTCVERVALLRSPLAKSVIGTEKIPTIVAPKFSHLGKLAALRFLEWVLSNPGGVIALPTGKTPEPFIRWTTHYLRTWTSQETQADFASWGLETNGGRKRPDMASLHLVQIGELYPTPSTRSNSLYSELREKYIKPFGLDESKALLMDVDRVGVPEGQTLESLWRSAQPTTGRDAEVGAEDIEVDLTLRYRSARNSQEEAQQRCLTAIDNWCSDYERRIRALGGIGFFLGGIGSDGHILFRSPPADHNSTTGLLPLTYAMQASAAPDLGASRRPASGWRAVALILAAGQQKARAVADAVMCPGPPPALYTHPSAPLHPAVDVPASVLRVLPNVRFYVTPSAASELFERRLALLGTAAHPTAGPAPLPPCTDADVERALVDLSCRTGTPILALRPAHYGGPLRRGRPPAARPAEPAALQALAHGSLLAKLERALRWPSPRRAAASPGAAHGAHPDDIVLSYLPFVVREQELHPGLTQHHFAVLTSGFRSVSNAYLQARLEQDVLPFLQTARFEALWTQGALGCRPPAPGEADPRLACPTARSATAAPIREHPWFDEVNTLLDGLAGSSPVLRSEARAAASCMAWSTTWPCPAPEARAQLEGAVRAALAHLTTAYPGAPTRAWSRPCRTILTTALKTYIREFEHEVLWGFFGWSRSNSARGAPVEEREVDPASAAPLTALMTALRPSIVTSAFDPTDSVPDTRLHSMLAVATALREYRKLGQPHRVLGYRNIWSSFHPCEANVFVPVSMTQLSIVDSAFMSCVSSQKKASFPSPTFDGPFSELSRDIMTRQGTMLKTCLGWDFFQGHPSPQIRACRGFLFLRDMSSDEFLEAVRMRS